jgi:hypothetical protein
MDKAIRVRVVDRENGRTNYAWHEVTINREHTLQMAVREIYGPLPGACQAVVVRMPGNPVLEVVWDTDDTEAEWMSDKYNRLQAGWEVEIWVHTLEPGGTRLVEAGKAAVGPLNARVAALLGELKRLEDVTSLHTLLTDLHKLSEP